MYISVPCHKHLDVNLRPGNGIIVKSSKSIIEKIINLLPFSAMSDPAWVKN